MAVDRLDDLFTGSQDGHEFLLKDELELFQRGEVAGIVHDDLEDRPLGGVRQNDIFPRDRFGHQFDDRRRDGDLGQVNELHAAVFGDGAADLLLGSIAKFDQGVLYFDAGLGRQPLGLFELIRREDLLADQKFGEVATSACHVCKAP